MDEPQFDYFAGYLFENCHVLFSIVRDETGWQIYCDYFIDWLDGPQTIPSDIRRAILECGIADELLEADDKMLVIHISGPLDPMLEVCRQSLKKLESE